MNAIHKTAGADSTPLSKWGDQRGIAGGCLIAIALLIVILVGGGMFVANHYRVWAAKAVTMAMAAVINESDLPAEEKNQIVDILDQVKENYLVEEIQLEELGTILEAMGDCPSLAIGMVVQFEASYVTPSALSEAQKAEAHLHLNRFAQGLINDSIGWGQLEDVTAPITEATANHEKTLKPPHRCSAFEIQQVVANAKAAADQQNIPLFFMDIDISDEFLKTIESALGRPLIRLDS
jgi:hypothetical protein